MMKTVGRNLNIVTALSASFLLHLVAFGVAAAVQSKARPDTIREYIPVDLVQLPAPVKVVVPQRAAAPRRQEVAAPVVPIKQPVMSPSPVIKSIASPQQSLPSSPSAMAVPQRSPATYGGGTPGATAAAAVTASGTATTQSQSRDKGSYLAFHRLSKLPSFSTRAEPVYPASERMNGSEARVLAEIYLNEHGGVDEVTIKKSGGPQFDKAVISAARQSSFHPGYMGDKAVPTVVQIPYTFKLK
jgi:TonB family protein